MKVWNQKSKLVGSLVCLVLILLFQSRTANASNSKNATNDSTYRGETMVFREISSQELTEEMGMGWNLGNTMDGHTGFSPGETIWQPVKTTKYLMKQVHDLGFNTVRIPVTWGTMIDDENNFAVNEAWISRVQDIVDYCISLDMYVIINLHHDGAEQAGWLRIASDDLELVKEKYEGVWKHISESFSGYDEHLIFESMNEVKGSSMTTLEENQVIMDLNQIFVDTVRATGSNNEKRWLVVTGKYNFIDSVCNELNGFQMPVDTVDNRLIVSVHDYTTWSFCGQEDTRITEYSLKQMQFNRDELKPLYDMYTSAGIPVIVGEYGCINKGNPTERAYYLEGMNRIFQEFGLIGIYWDQGWFDRTMDPDYSFSIIDRVSGLPIEKEITDAMFRGFFTKGKSDLSDIVKNPIINTISKLDFDVEQLEINIGETYQLKYSISPNESNDVILWKSEDETVATVAYGKIHAKGLGITAIIGYSQSGSVEKKIEIEVNKENIKIPCKDIGVNEEIQLQEAEYTYLEIKKIPANTDESIYYRSLNETVATISPIGKLLALQEGTAVLEVSTSGGIKKEIMVEVMGATSENKVELTLNVYYNDSQKNYFGNETSSEVITVTGNGEYHVTFHCDEDLSEAAINAGINSLNNLTAIYIKDNQVITGETTTSPLQTCDISYEKILVDGQELTITSGEAKSALKKSGIFDSNDPINGWDGSYVEEIKESNKVVNFTAITEPKSIEVVFRISNMVFADGTIADEVKVIEESDVDISKENSNTDITMKEKVNEEVKEEFEEADESFEEGDKTNTRYFFFLSVITVCVIVVVVLFIWRNKKKEGNKHEINKK